jgi:hypothetical protein
MTTLQGFAELEMLKISGQLVDRLRSVWERTHRSQDMAERNEKLTTWLALLMPPKIVELEIVCPNLGHIVALSGSSKRAAGGRYAHPTLRAIKVSNPCARFFDEPDSDSHGRHWACYFEQAGGTAGNEYDETNMAMVEGFAAIGVTLDIVDGPRRSRLEIEPGMNTDGVIDTASGVASSA